MTAQARTRTEDQVRQSIRAEVFHTTVGLKLKSQPISEYLQECNTIAEWIEKGTLPQTEEPNANS